MMMTMPSDNRENSQGLSVPKDVLETHDSKENEKLAIKIDNEKIAKRERKNLKELFAHFDGEYQVININWGEPVGEEIR